MALRTLWCNKVTVLFFFFCKMHIYFLFKKAILHWTLQHLFYLKLILLYYLPISYDPWQLWLNMFVPFGKGKNTNKIMQSNATKDKAQNKWSLTTQYCVFVCFSTASTLLLLWRFKNRSKTNKYIQVDKRSLILKEV